MALLCMLPPATFNAACGPLEIGVEEDSGDEQQIDEGPARTRATSAGAGVGVVVVVFMRVTSARSLLAQPCRKSMVP
jgi:hypothetical protein